MNDHAGVGCAACGRARTTVTIEDGHLRSDCRRCRSATFESPEVGTPRDYERLYETGETLTARLGRARVQLLAAPGWRTAPPPRLRTTDLRVLDVVLRRTQTGAVVLDWGCGSARVSQALLRRGRRAVPVDIVLPLVERLRDAGFDARHIDDELPDQRHVPVILALELLEHLPDPAQLVAEFRRRWPGSTLIVSVPAPRRQAVVDDEREAWDRPPEHLVRFSEDGLRQLLERCGYEADVVAPAPTIRDHVPWWWRRLAAIGLPIHAWSSARGPRMRRWSALALLWLHAGYVRVGYLIGALSPARLRTDITAQSMVAVAIPTHSESEGDR